MGFMGKQWVFGKTMFIFKTAMFLTRLYTGFILIIKHINFIKIKIIHVLHKLKKSQSYRPCFFKNFHKFPSVLHLSTLNLLLLVLENHCVFLAHIFRNCAFFPRNVREKRITQTKKYHCK